MISIERTAERLIIFVVAHHGGNGDVLHKFDGLSGIGGTIVDIVGELIPCHLVFGVLCAGHDFGGNGRKYFKVIYKDGTA